MLSANAPDSPFTDFFRRLRATKALHGVEILPGAQSLSQQTQPGRIVIWPSDGTWMDASDRSIGIADIDQRVIAQCWGRGSSTGGDEQQLADWNMTWRVLQLLTQAMAEQGESPSNPTSPGYFWKTAGVIGWDVGPDTTQEGTSVSAMFVVTCTMPAASDDFGHVGDNFPTGAGTSVEITSEAP